MKLVKILGVIAIIAGLLLVGGLFYINHYVQTPEFKQQVLDAARKAVGTEVKVDALTVSLFSGIELEGVSIANPEGFTGQLLTAKAFVLRYRLLPLLQKRVEVETLTLDSPTITMAKNATGEWNYDKLGSATEQKPAAAPVTITPATPSSGGTSSSTLDIAINHIEMKNASIVMLGDNQKEMLRINNANLTMAVSLTGDKLNGSGKAGIELVNAGNSLLVRNFAAPLALNPTDLKLTPLGGKVADGDIGGDVTVNLVGGFKYGVNLQVKNAQVVKLLEEASVAKKAFSNGKLQLNIALTGTGGLATMTGTGRAEVVDGTLVKMPLQDLLAALLRLPELSELQFTECVLEFDLANNVMQTPVIKLTAPHVRVTGKGSVKLEDYSLNHDLTLAIAKTAFDKMPKEILGIFKEQSDGYLAISFHVSGPYDSPKTDLQERLLKGAGEQLLQKGLQKLFK